MSGLFYFTLCFGVHSHCSVNQYFIPFCALVSPVQLFGTPGAVTRQPPLSMGFCRQEYWGGLPVPSLGDLPNPGIEPGSPTLQADSLSSESPGKPVKHDGKSESTQVAQADEISNNCGWCRNPVSDQSFFTDPDGCTKRSAGGSGRISA